MRLDVYEVARDGAPPHFRPSRAQAALADAALWQAAGFVAARIAARSAEDVWAELRRFTAMDEIWGRAPTPGPTTACCSPPTTADELRELHFTRDRECLRRDD